MNTFIVDGLQIVDRLRDEARTATRSWTLIEAYMGRDETHRERLRQGLSYAGLATTSHVIMKSLQHDSSLTESIEAQSHILSIVPPSWKNPPEDVRLFDLRTRLRPIRDSLLSHALDYSTVQQATFDETRSFLQLVNELQRSASRTFYASCEALQTRWDVALKEAHRFWDMVETGVATNQEDLRFRP